DAVSWSGPCRAGSCRYRCRSRPVRQARAARYRGSCAGTTPRCIGQTAPMPTKVILDVDTGTDDAVALMIAALSPDLELVGATSVNGNTTVDYTTENTLRVFDWIGMPEISAIRGLDRPMARPQVSLRMAQ